MEPPPSASNAAAYPERVYTSPHALTRLLGDVLVGGAEAPAVAAGQAATVESRELGRSAVLGCSVASLGKFVVMLKSHVKSLKLSESHKVAQLRMG